MLRHLRTLTARAALHQSRSPLSTQTTAATSSTEKVAESRWQRLRRERRRAPTPANRVAHEYDRKSQFSLSAALQHVRGAAWAKFDESLELIFRLNIDPRLSDQNIRGAFSLPHGTGRRTPVAVFADPDAAAAALAAGAELAGAEELVDAIAADKGASVKGFAACLAQPHLVPMAAAKLGRILGPRGLMPSPKSGTVGMDVVALLNKVKKGQVPYRTDRAGNLHLIVGKLSFDDEQLAENVRAATRAIMDVRPQSVKKRYMQKAVLSSSMGPAVELDLKTLVQESMEQAV